MPEIAFVSKNSFKDLIYYIYSSLRSNLTALKLITEVFFYSMLTLLQEGISFIWLLLLLQRPQSFPGAIARVANLKFSFILTFISDFFSLALKMFDHNR